ncbi:MAG TPA: hypothetical protein VEX61_01415 [Burkholderiales bacterium]|nr:hypothetical protein [Burkholderiales bacterium]
MSALLATLLLSLFAPQQAASPDAEGFIRNWLVLAPIAIEGDQGATEIDREFIKGEATIRPKAGEAVPVGPGQSVTWTAHQTSDYFIDFLQSFGKARGDYVAGYAVAYVIADEEMKVTLALSTNDQGKVWLNGKQVFKFAETRTLEKDTDKIDVTLNKGENVLVMKVVNEVNNWQGCARFLRDGKPLTGLKVQQAPQ